MNGLLLTILARVPFSFLWFLRRAIGKAETVLDLGCGEGSLMESLRINRDWKATGVDIFPKSVKQAREKGVYNQVICGDVLEVAKKLVAQRHSFDVVFCSQLMEHLSREKGEELLAVVGDLAKKRVVIQVPRGYMDQPEVFLEDNPYQVHQSGWKEEDFLSRGYSVHGLGLKLTWSYSGWGRSPNKLLALLSLVVSFLASPVVYFVPRIGSGLLCIREQ